MLAAFVPLVGSVLRQLAGSLGLVVVLPAVFFPLYYVFPGRNVTVREGVPGAVFAATRRAILGRVFGLYASYAGGFQLYGVLGGVLLVLVWFYSVTHEDSSRSGGPEAHRSRSPRLRRQTRHQSSARSRQSWRL
ncbi:hypothetical protein BRC65_05060 [Halobacteriales archaeon QH_2_65_14]|nr:MAG: hypothetical protein BRC65_05060 [Halobacteriales archaeon QH_2_65_14]